MLKFTSFNGRAKILGEEREVTCNQYVDREDHYLEIGNLDPDIAIQIVEYLRNLLPETTGAEVTEQLTVATKAVAEAKQAVSVAISKIEVNSNNPDNFVFQAPAPAVELGDDSMPATTEPPKRRGRPRKETVIVEATATEPDEAGVEGAPSNEDEAGSDYTLFAKVGKLGELLPMLHSLGCRSPESYIVKCKELLPHVPLLQRISNLEERVTQSVQLKGLDQD